MIYLDNNATTKPSSAAITAMQIYLHECYFNASTSTAELTGANRPYDDAAAAMTFLLEAEDPTCFTFTSGATESNNWIFSNFSDSSHGRIVISTIEHPSVSDSASQAATCGKEVVNLPVDGQGIILLADLANLLTPNTQLVSIMAANNETGALQPIHEIGQLVRKLSPMALFHTDATQAVGKIAINLQEDWSDVDLLSFSAHKFHGPKGIGGLYCRPGIELKPLILGGGQQKGLRSGTMNTPALAGLAAAVQSLNLLAASKIEALRDYFEQHLAQALPVTMHSVNTERLPNTSCFSIAGTSGEYLAQELALAGIIVGTGSACSSGSLHPPKTLLAMGIEYGVAQSALRVSLSSLTTIEEIDMLLNQLIHINK
ncbi:cysteine desulfurase family protein [Herbaspirillum sp. RTI4]|uniref:cysteine desulfurase family protein n=1 Tax=Herbaspirillum sp. RTI4 TaxID=3048640 RepID=UPI002AB4D42A|nr:cysteine desulfurase family protein [Herbaspirillum sp. RTI4]MDY7577267.1 cysteine desulfurase family protein [Herbaspirillum sp. RTI4]MEA9980557.1 cysteine desulfurase family protein [Herbaspirillum sp. RTI4]